jgi:hypothetical protein
MVLELSELFALMHMLADQPEVDESGSGASRTRLR